MCFVCVCCGWEFGGRGGLQDVAMCCCPPGLSFLFGSCVDTGVWTPLSSCPPHLFSCFLSVFVQLSPGPRAQSAPMVQTQLSDHILSLSLSLSLTLLLSLSLSLSLFVSLSQCIFHSLCLSFFLSVCLSFFFFLLAKMFVWSDDLKWMALFNEASPLWTWCLHCRGSHITLGHVQGQFTWRETGEMEEVGRLYSVAFKDTFSHELGV